MKVQQVVIKEFKALSNIDEQINGNNIFIMGENGLGKSSFMQFIAIALGDTSNIPANIEGSGHVVVDKDGREFIFNVKFKDGKPLVTVTTPEGMKDNRKSAIASIVGAIDFDVENFVELSKTKKGQKEQVEIFKEKFIDEETKSELRKYEVNIDVAYSERTDVNRQISEIKSFITSHPLRNENLSEIKSIDVEQLSKEKEEERDRLNLLYKRNKEANEALRATWNGLKDRINKEVSDHNNAIAEHRINYNAAFDAAKTLVKYGLEFEIVEPFIKSLAAKVGDIKDAKTLYTEEPNYIQELPDNSELKKIEDRILSASELNVKFNEAQNLIKKIELLKELEEESGNLTVKIDAGRQAISDCIKDMNSPINGLSYSEDTLVYNGVPVTHENLSSSEITELGVKLKMAENPDFGILFIQRGESIGTQRMKDILTLAKTNGWQVFMEQVKRGQDKITFEIISENEN